MERRTLFEVAGRDWGRKGQSEAQSMYLGRNLPAAMKAIGAKRKERIVDGLWGEGTKGKTGNKVGLGGGGRSKGHALYAKSNLS